MHKSSRQRARSWPYQRHKDFEVPLRKAAASWFESKGFKVRKKYPYILDSKNQWPDNIIVPKVADFIRSEKRRRKELGQGFPLHRFIHHGLSSQAMLFNLIGSLIVREDLSVLEAVFVKNGIPWPTGKVNATFEVEKRDVFNEDSGQPTSIDLVIKGNEAEPALFIEAKFVEHEFGGCSVFRDGDCDGRNPVGDLSLCYLHHIGRRYWDHMSDYGFLQGLILDSPTCILANYYQFFREVLFAIHQGGYFILLCDDRNPTFLNDGPKGTRGLWPFLVSLIPDSVQTRLKRISIQEVFRAIRASGRHEDWTDQFAARYRIADQR